jgi:hypothetical protein
MSVPLVAPEKKRHRLTTSKSKATPQRHRTHKALTSVSQERKLGTSAHAKKADGMVSEQRRRARRNVSYLASLIRKACKEALPEITLPERTPAWQGAATVNESVPLVHAWWDWQESCYTHLRTLSEINPDQYDWSIISTVFGTRDVPVGFRGSEYRLLRAELQNRGPFVPPASISTLVEEPEDDRSTTELEDILAGPMGMFYCRPCSHYSHPFKVNYKLQKSMRLSVTRSTRRSSTPDTDRGLSISTFMSLRLSCPLRHLPCMIAGPASSHHTYHLVSTHHHRCDTPHPAMPPTLLQTYLPGRLSPLSYFQISCSYILCSYSLPHSSTVIWFMALSHM